MQLPTSAIMVLLSGGLLLGCGPSKKELKADLAEVQGKLDATIADKDRLTKSFESQVAQLESDLERDRTALAKLTAENQLTSEQLAQARADQARRDKELGTYKRMFDRLRTLVDTGKIKVVFRKGRLMVQLESAVLFDSGKTKLKDDGKASLAAVVEALKGEGRDFLVGGHTDNVPIKSRKFASNWELSTQRAVTVVRYMVEEEFPAANLGAAGFGEFDPIANNDAPEGRAENRRIEIVLMPSEAQMKGIRSILGADGKKGRKKGKGRKKKS